jgi:hypothetical protein
MGLRKAPKPLTRADLPTMAQVANMSRADQLEAWKQYREVTIRERAEAYRASRKREATTGKPAHQNGPLREDQLERITVPITAFGPAPPETPPEWWGSLDGPRWTDAGAMQIDRDGRELYRDPDTGRLLRANQAKLDERAYVGDAASSGERTISRAAQIAALKRIPIEQAQAELDALGDDGTIANSQGEPIRFDPDQGRYVPAGL